MYIEYLELQNAWAFSIENSEQFGIYIAIRTRSSAGTEKAASFT